MSPYMKKSFLFAVVITLLVIFGVGIAGEVATNAAAVITPAVEAVAKAPALVNFWDVHSVWFIFFMLLFPRLTMLFMGICFYSFAYPVWFWVGWVLSPRLVIAILATCVYWDTNPVLCVFAWFNALCVGSASTKTSTEYANNRRG